MNIELGDDKRSLDRPAWTQDDLHAYRHKHTRREVFKDYYVKSKGKHN